MNIRTRMITLVSALLVAIAIAPQSAIAAKPSNPSNPLILTAPYAADWSYGYCRQAGTGVCAAEDTADASTGHVTVSGTASADQNPLSSTPTGTALAIPQSGVSEYFKVPIGGASSITFTVTAHIDSATAQGDAAGNSYAVVFFYLSAFWGSCSDCTATVFDTIVSSVGYPSSVTNVDQTITFVLKSASGQRLSSGNGRSGNGTGRIALQLVGNARVDEGSLISASAHAEGYATFTGVTVTFVS